MLLHKISFQFRSKFSSGSLLAHKGWFLCSFGLRLNVSEFEITLLEIVRTRVFIQILRRLKMRWLHTAIILSSVSHEDMSFSFVINFRVFDFWWWFCNEIWFCNRQIGLAPWPLYTYAEVNFSNWFFDPIKLILTYCLRPYLFRFKIRMTCWPHRLPGISESKIMFC